MGMRVVRIYGGSNNVKNASPAPPGVEVWCVNNPRMYRIQRVAAFKEWTRWFNLHTTKHQKARYARGYEWFQRKVGRIIYLQDVDPTIASSVKFPRRELQEFFKTSPKPQRYFTCTGAWMLAFAIYEKFDRIEIYGHQMKINGEHAHQREGFLYWVEEARRRGIEVVVPKGCIGHPEGDGTPTKAGDPNTYKGPLYGYEAHSAFYKETF